MMQVQRKYQDDKLTVLNKMERKFTSQLEELQRRGQEMKRDHVSFLHVLDKIM